MQNTYNLYPTFLNIDKDGHDLKSIHSSDEINVEITSIISEDDSLIVGKFFNNEEEVLDYIISRIEIFLST